jgi:hypothetical protein
MRRTGSRDRFRAIRATGWANSHDVAIVPSPETIAAVEQFAKRKQPRCVAPTADSVKGKTGVPGEQHPIGRITDEARDMRQESG